MRACSDGSNSDKASNAAPHRAGCPQVALASPKIRDGSHCSNKASSTFAPRGRGLINATFFASDAPRSSRDAFTSSAFLNSLATDSSVSLTSSSSSSTLSTVSWSASSTGSSSWDGSESPSNHASVLRSASAFTVRLSCLICVEMSAAFRRHSLNFLRGSSANFIISPKSKGSDASKLGATASTTVSSTATQSPSACARACPASSASHQKGWVNESGTTLINAVTNSTLEGGGETQFCNN
mmetsp:Transcript_24345/g.68459  ORF Transcript_24345/g.68459 Transcript_24345/m.68459 type:complete len:240 (+) Transcript_24345:2036-2755(+)